MLLIQGYEFRTLRRNPTCNTLLIRGYEFHRMCRIPTCCWYKDTSSIHCAISLHAIHCWMSSIECAASLHAVDTGYKFHTLRRIPTCNTLLIRGYEFHRMCRIPTCCWYKDTSSIHCAISLHAIHCWYEDTSSIHYAVRISTCNTLLRFKIDIFDCIIYAMTLVNTKKACYI